MRRRRALTALRLANLPQPVLGLGQVGDHFLHPGDLRLVRVHGRIEGYKLALILIGLFALLSVVR